MNETLTGLTDKGLADLYATGDEATQKACLREAARRDRADRTRARDRKRANARRHAAVEEWVYLFQADFLAAEAECRGYLLSREGLAAGIDPARLWTGKQEWANRMASEELRAFWQRRPRVTRSEWKRQVMCH